MSASNRKPRVLVADDHRIVAEGLRALLEPEYELLEVVEDGHQLDPPDPWAETGDQVLHRAELRQTVREAIDQLPDTYRNVLLLRDIEELDTQETADVLGISTNATKTRLHRARQALRTLLDGHLREKPA